MSKKVAIVQSNYIPWKGYFDMIAAVDEFILYDDAQFTRRDWRNRNLIKTPDGAQWLTVPVRAKGRFRQTIRETEIDGADWSAKHWRTLERNYARAAHFDATAAWLAGLYGDRSHSHLAQLNRAFIEAICAYLGIETTITDSADYRLPEGKTERLVSLCEQAGATEYVSGPAARDYLEPGLFAARDIELTWFDYAGYPPYPQLWGEFVHEVSILDLIFNCGKDAVRHMRYPCR